MSVRVRFLGGAGTVTGSKFLVAGNGRRVLVDCGLFQGLKDLRLRNWAPFPVPPREIDAVILTHAHLDHSGYLPKLVREGFRGPVYAGAATKELSRLLLRDSAYLMEEEAEYLNRRKLSRHRPALPLYTMAEAERALERFVPVGFGARFDLGGGDSFELRPAGHILGAASVALRMAKRNLFFSGDVGRLRDPVLPAPAPPVSSDVLLIESTYGNRSHRRADPRAEIEAVVKRAANRGGVVLIPAFAVGRAQQILHFLAGLKNEGRLPPGLPIYLNSPMASEALDIFRRFDDLHRLSPGEVRDLCEVARIVRTPEESKALNAGKGPMIVISASGMLTGGRVIHHMKEFAPDPKNVILLTGFQAAGTRGRALLDGATEVKIHGQYVPVRAEVVVLDSLSAHADASEILEWLGTMKGPPPSRVMLVHGEPSAADELRRRIGESFGWAAEVAQPNAEIEV